MNNLPTLLKSHYAALSDFSDLNWEQVSQEFLELFSPEDEEMAVMQFPLYLQDKANEGDCPDYLFELAYYLLAHSQVSGSEIELSGSSGYFLNPTASFLDLEFDILKMLNENEIAEKNHVLCISKNQNGDIKVFELSDKELEILSQLEEGPLQEAPSVSAFQDLIKKNLIIQL